MHAKPRYLSYMGQEKMRINMWHSLWSLVYMNKLAKLTYKLHVRMLTTSFQVSLQIRLVIKL